MATKIIVIVFLWFAIFTSENSSQVKLKAFGGEVGVGLLSGNSPQIFSNSFSFFSDIELRFTNPATIRFEVIYLNDFNSLIPDNRQGKYYPFLKGGSIQFLFQQAIFKRLYFEEGFGPLFLNDRTFSDVNTWNYGAVFSFSAGINFFENGENGLSLSIAAGFGNTFTKTTPQYFFIALQPKYGF